MSLVQYVLKRPYTVVSLLILITLLGIAEALRMPVDIFPEMDTKLNDLGQNIIRRLSLLCTARRFRIPTAVNRG